MFCAICTPSAYVLALVFSATECDRYVTTEPSQTRCRCQSAATAACTLSPTSSRRQPRFSSQDGKFPPPPAPLDAWPEPLPQKEFTEDEVQDFAAEWELNKEAVLDEVSGVGKQRVGMADCVDLSSNSTGATTEDDQSQKAQQAEDDQVCTPALAVPLHIRLYC